MADIDPVDGSRDGWSYSTYKRIGAAEIAHRTPRTMPGVGTLTEATLYGVYGVRGDRVFVQHEGARLTDGSILGLSLLASSMDSTPYIWGPRKWFTKVKIFEVAQP
jgi:hypothetical protein